MSWFLGRRSLLVGTMACGLAAAPLAEGATSQRVSSPDQPAVVIVTEDIGRFWEAFDQLASATSWEDSVRILQEQYLDSGSDGLLDFAAARIESAENLLRTIRDRPGTYAAAREPTLRIPAMEPQLRAVLGHWLELFPHTDLPTLTFVVGRYTSGGTTSARGILIGSEMYGRTDQTPEEELDAWLRDVLRPVEDVPGIVAHELVHTHQQRWEGETLLIGCLVEGIADYFGQLVSGENINEAAYAWAEPRRDVLLAEFAEVMHGTELGGWLYGRRAPDEPNDLGYWVGREIAAAYVRNAADEREAYLDLLGRVEPMVILRGSRLFNAAAGPARDGR